MLNYIVKGLAKIFGTKSNRDVESMSPVVEVINQHFAEYASLSNDQLRGKTLEFRERISAYLSEIDQRITELTEGRARAGAGGKGSPVQRGGQVEKAA